MGANELPERVKPLDSEVAEEWVRKTGEPDVRGVRATRLLQGGDWPWRVTIWAAEFVREDPLEQELRDSVRAALTAVKGVTRAEEEDRELWAVAGQADGEALVKAAAD